MSRSLTDSIVRKTQLPQLTHQATHRPTTRVGTNTTTAQHLVSILARIWATELGGDPETRLLRPATDRDDASKGQVSAIGGTTSSSARRRDLLPPKDQADKWLQVFLNGPNKLMHICSPRESLQLITSLYDQDQTISPEAECLLTWQLTIGARYTADVDEQTYTTIYASARIQTEVCIENDGNEMLLWIVPILLLRCVYHMDSHPRKCWLVLGRRKSSC